MEFIPAGSRSRFNSSFMLRYHPMTSCPPIKLVLVCSKDSKYLLDEHQNGTTELSVAVAKFRMTGYLWQAFIAEKMSSRENQRRTFQLENDWSESSLYFEDFGTGEMRNQTPIHIVSLDHTTEELSSVNSTQFAGIVEQALIRRFPISKSQRSNFACMFMDADWNQESQTPIRNFEYGGFGIAQPDQVGLAIYSAHFIASYPASIDSVTACFADERQTPGHPETTRWKCATRGIGDHLKLVGHMLGLPEQAYGMMSDESYSIASLFSMYATQHMFELRLHPLDMVRLRHHSIFQSPFAPIEKLRSACSPSFWGQNDNTIFISSQTGLLAIEIFASGDNVCQHWISLLDKRGMPRYSYTVSLAEIVKLAQPKSNRYSTFHPRQGPYTLQVLTADGKTTPIVDFETFAKTLVATGINSKTPTFKSQAVGIAVSESQSERILFPAGARMRGLTVFHSPGDIITGVEFMFESEKVMFGKKDGEAHKEWRVNADSGEVLMGIELCVKESLRGLRLFTSSGRWSPWFGDATNGTE
jgi:Putative peptidase family